MDRIVKILIFVLIPHQISTTTYDPEVADSHMAPQNLDGSGAHDEAASYVSEEPEPNLDSDEPESKTLTTPYASVEPERKNLTTPCASNETNFDLQPQTLITSYASEEVEPKVLITLCAPNKSEPNIFCALEDADCHLEQKTLATSYASENSESNLDTNESEEKFSTIPRDLDDPKSSSLTSSVDPEEQDSHLKPMILEGRPKIFIEQCKTKATAVIEKEMIEILTTIATTENDAYVYNINDANFMPHPADKEEKFLNDKCYVIILKETYNNMNFWNVYCVQGKKSNEVSSKFALEYARYLQQCLKVHNISFMYQTSVNFSNKDIFVKDALTYFSN